MVAFGQTYRSGATLEADIAVNRPQPHSRHGEHELTPCGSRLNANDSDAATLAVAGMLAASRAPRERRFKRLVSEWKQQRNEYSSDPREWAMCPAYQKIIAMGPEAIPLVLNELRRRPDHWFWALDMLTDANPIQADHCGNFTEMVSDWLQWGRNNGFIWD